MPVLQAYGMTEASHQMCVEPAAAGRAPRRNGGPATGIEVAVVDEDWTPARSRRTGEVVVRGASVVDGYLDSPESNADVVPRRLVPHRRQRRSRPTATSRSKDGSRS